MGKPVYPVYKTIPITAPRSITSETALIAYLRGAAVRSIDGGVLCPQTALVTTQMGGAGMFHPIALSFWYIPSLFGPQDWQRDDGPAD